MKVSIPAIRATMGSRQYYMNLVVPRRGSRLFRFNDWSSAHPSCERNEC